MKLVESTEFLKSLNVRGIHLGLARVKELCKALGNPQNNIKAIHIAGTNGKGSTAAFLASILIEQGYKVGVFNSPYLLKYNEMYKVNNVEITDEKLGSLTEKMQIALNSYSLKEEPTQFEVFTAMAFQYFSAESVDFAIIETGVGGREDSTNIINPILSVITSISYDHIGLLGSDILNIAKAKAGIIKSKVPVVCYPNSNDILKVISDEANVKKSKLITIQDDYVNLIGIDKADTISQNFTLKLQNKTFSLNTSLLGRHQLLNAAVAINAAFAISELGYKISEEAIESGVIKARWPLRFEVVSNNPLVIIDGAHNEDGIRGLKKTLKEYIGRDKVKLILGVLKDKEVEKIVKEIISVAESVYCIEPDNERAMRAVELCDIVKQNNCMASAYNSYEAALMAAKSDCTSDGVILVCGSLYLAGKMKNIL